MYQKDLLLSTSQCCVEPTVEVLAQLFVTHFSRVDKHTFPLSALRFVARHGVGKAHL